MARNSLLTLLVVVLAVTAGCLGTGGDGGAEDGTTTDVPTTDVETTPDAGAGQGNSGADTADGWVATDPENALRSAGSFTSTMRFSGTGQGAETGELTNRYSVDLENERFFGHVEAGDAAGTASVIEWFSADGVTYTRIGSGEEVVYVRDTEENRFSMSEATLDDTYFAYAAENDEWLTREGTETYDGVTVTRYEATGVEKWAYFEAYAREDGEVTDFEYVVLVDDDGLVRYLSWHLAGVDNSGGESRPFSQTVEMELTDVGSTTVEDPAWLSEATDRAISN
jgi:hypothetical protein